MMQIFNVSTYIHRNYANKVTKIIKKSKYMERKSCPEIFFQVRNCKALFPTVSEQ